MSASDALFRLVWAVALWLAGLSLAGLGAAAAQDGPFSYYSGAFRGPGYFMSDDGARKSLSCRATGESAGDGRVLSQNIACDSANYKFDIRAQIVADGAEARGQWREATRDAAGPVSGRIAGQRFIGASEAKGFAGRFKFHAGPRKLIFTFWPDGGKPARVHASLVRQQSGAAQPPVAAQPPAAREKPRQPPRRKRHRHKPTDGLILLN